MGVRTREKPKDSGVWWVFIHHEGRRTSRRVGNQEAAEEAARQIQARLTLGQDALPARRKRVPTLAVYFERIKKNYLKTATRPRTLESYQTNFDLHILPSLGSRHLDEITKEDVRNRIAALVDTGKAKTTIRIIVAELCAVLNHAVEDELIVRNPAAKCSKFYAQAPVRNEEIQPLNPEEVGLFLKAVASRPASMKHYPLFLCAIHTGMRSGRDRRPAVGRHRRERLFSHCEAFLRGWAHPAHQDGQNSPCGPVRRAPGGFTRAPAGTSSVLAEERRQRAS